MTAALGAVAEPGLIYVAVAALILAIPAINVPRFRHLRRLRLRRKAREQHGWTGWLDLDGEAPPPR